MIPRSERLYRLWFEDYQTTRKIQWMSMAVAFAYGCIASFGFHENDRQVALQSLAVASLLTIGYSVRYSFVRRAALPKRSEPAWLKRGFFRPPAIVRIGLAVFFLLAGEIPLPSGIRFRVLSLNALTIPTPEDVKAMTPNEVNADLKTTVSFVDTSLRKQIVGNSEALTTARDRLQSLLKSPNLPSKVRPVATSALLYTQAYLIFTTSPQFSLIGFTLDCQLRPSEAVAVVAPMIPGVTRPPLVNQTAALTYLRVPRLEDAAVYGVTILNCHPVPGDPHRICKQDLTYALWVKSTFKNSTVVYDGGPLHLVDVSFINCQFEFGTDERSREALRQITEAKGEPVTIDFEGFPPDYHMTPLVQSGDR